MQKIIVSQHGELHLANFPRNTLIFNISRQFQYLFDANMLGSPFYNKFNIRHVKDHESRNYVRFDVFPFSFQV